MCLQSKLGRWTMTGFRKVVTSDSEEKIDTDTGTGTGTAASAVSVSAQRQTATEHRVVSTSTTGYTATNKTAFRRTDSSTITSSSTSSSSATSSVSANRMIKANSVTSPFAKFRQLERQNSLPSSASAKTAIAISAHNAKVMKFADSKLSRSASSIKDRLLNWVKAQTKDYKNIQIDNFSSSWNNGLAFCALIHHFHPNAFDYDKLTPQQRRYNFELAFKVAEQEAGIVPLLDVEDMVTMKRPDWKCVFTYVQTIYQRFHASPEAIAAL